MKNDQLSLIGIRIKQIRIEKKLTLRELAKRSNLSPGLISKIENFRTMPSLTVLVDISMALEVDLADLVKNLNSNGDEPYILIREAEGELESREDSPELIYKFLLAQKLGGFSLRVNKIEIPAGAYRKLIGTNAYELLYVIRGKITYFFKDHEVEIQTGDTLYFDGRLPHGVRNEGENAELLKMYLISASD